MAARRHPAFDRAGARWVARLGLERGLNLEELRFALAAVTELPRHPECDADTQRARAVQKLARERYGARELLRCC